MDKLLIWLGKFILRTKEIKGKFDTREISYSIPFQNDSPDASWKDIKTS